MVTTTANSTYDQKIRRFEPVILFHDHVYVKEETQHLEHIHIPYKDPQYVSLIEKHKIKTKQMLDVNGKYWTDGLIDDTSSINSSFNQISISSSNSLDHSLSSSPLPNQTTSLPLLISSKSHPIIKKEMILDDDEIDQKYPSSHHHRHHHHHHQTYERRRRKSSVSSTSSSSIIEKKINNNNNNNNNNSNNSSRKRRGNLPRAVTSVLREWLANHKQHPYPTDEEKLALSQQTHLTINQVSNWFINARRRILITMLEEDKKLNSMNNNNNSDNNDNSNSNHNEHRQHGHSRHHTSKLIF
ncbi:unnamed protein product [Cunninghamella blakesleeana]